MGAAAVPLIMAAVAGGASYVSTRNTARRQDNASADMIRNQARRQQQADKAVSDQVDQLGKSRMAGEKARLGGAYLQQLKANQGAINSGFTSKANVSDAFKDAATDASLGVATKLSGDADIMATIDAAGAQREREALDRANMGSRIDQIARDARGAAFLDQLRMQGIRRNPWLDALSAAASTYGSAGAGMGGAEKGIFAGASNGMAGASSGLGNLSGIGAGLAGGTRWGP